MDDGQTSLIAHIHMFSKTECSFDLTICTKNHFYVLSSFKVIFRERIVV